MRSLLIPIVLICLASASFSLNCTNSTSCSDNQQCVVGTCAPVPCDCGDVKNHTCTHYQCCSDTQCAFVQRCTNHTCAFRSECAPPNLCCANDTACPGNQSCAEGMCAPIQCDCGFVANHTCTPYRCCSNSQCAANENCMNHTCVLKNQTQCTPPECCVSDSQCGGGEQCAVGKCASVQCDCGFVQNHVCTNYRCCGDSQCNSTESCVNHLCILKAPEQCTPPMCCVSDTQCAGTQRCAIKGGEKNGTCEEIVACGIIANHAIAETWECDDLSVCPACEDGGCVDHKCLTAQIAAPTSVSQGGTAAFRILVQQQVCGDCGVVVSAPSGARFNVAMDEEGRASIQVSEAGSYYISVLKESVPLKTIAINSLAKTPAGPDGNVTGPVTPAKGDSSLPIIVAAFVVVVLAGVGALIYFAGKEKQE